MHKGSRFVRSKRHIVHDERAFDKLPEDFEDHVAELLGRFNALEHDSMTGNVQVSNQKKKKEKEKKRKENSQNLFTFNVSHSYFFLLLWFFFLLSFIFVIFFVLIIEWSNKWTFGLFAWCCCSHWCCWSCDQSRWSCGWKNRKGSIV